LKFSISGAKGGPVGDCPYTEHPDLHFNPTRLSPDIRDVGMIAASATLIARVGLTAKIKTVLVG
jgi:hypothetical protein